MTEHRRTFMATCLSGGSTTAVDVSTESVAPRWSLIASQLVSLFLIFLGNAVSSYASPLVPQTVLDGNCVPKFVVPLPVFGPAGSVPRVDASSHPKLTVTMKEIDQAVLPQGVTTPCGVKFGKTRIWAYETTDTSTGNVLGPAIWPAVTIVAKRGVATRVKYVNQLPSFNPSDPKGPGLVQ